MKRSALLVPIAAIAALAPHAYAYDAAMLKAAGLDNEQIVAFTVARDMRQEGDVRGAREVLSEAGIDASALTHIEVTAAQHRKAVRNALETALANQDYATYIKVVAEAVPGASVLSPEAFEKLAQVSTDT